MTQAVPTVTRRAIRSLQRLGRLAICRLQYPFFRLPELHLPEITGEDDTIFSPILDKVCLPPYVAPNTHDDFTVVLKIARALEPRVVCELGTAHGNLTANICQQCPTATVVTVNAPADEQTGVNVTYELTRQEIGQLTRQEIGQVYRDFGFKDRVRQIFSDTMDLNLAQCFSGPAIDLGIIDACHDTEYVINDFLKILPFMNPAGVILLHDTHPSMKRHLLGSYEACMKLRRQGHDIRHVEGSWWGVWFAPGALSALSAKQSPL